MQPTRATANVINQLKNLYRSDRFQFELNCSMLLAGDNNKELRQEIVLWSTGKKEPKTKCSLFYTAEILKANFEQTKLF